MNVQPLVTIGIANYNYARYITYALKSVVEQDYKNIELIIVDDRSTDASVDVVEEWIQNYQGKYKITFIQNPVNIGIAKVCNTILSRTSGKYYQILDADDILLPGKITAQVEILENNENCALVYSNMRVIDDNGNETKPDYLSRIGYGEQEMPSGNIFKRLFHFNFIPNTSVLLNTECVKEIGGYDERLQVQDYYLYLTLAEKYEILYMQGSTALYRIHNRSVSNTVASNAHSIEAVLTLLYRYYKKGDAEIKREIKRNIHHSAAYLYECNHPAAMLWLHRDLKLNPGSKTLAYFVAKKIGLPFNLIAAVKKRIQSVT